MSVMNVMRHMVVTTIAIKAMHKFYGKSTEIFLNYPLKVFIV